MLGANMDMIDLSRGGKLVWNRPGDRFARVLGGGRLERSHILHVAGQWSGGLTNLRGPVAPTARGLGATVRPRQPV